MEKLSSRSRGDYQEQGQGDRQVSGRNLGNQASMVSSVELRRSLWELWPPDVMGLCSCWMCNGGK